jgi:hypothetical protein
MSVLILVFKLAYLPRSNVWVAFTRARGNQFASIIIARATFDTASRLKPSDRGRHWP